jgi:hypothetical protein
MRNPQGSSQGNRLGSREPAGALLNRISPFMTRVQWNFSGIGAFEKAIVADCSGRGGVKSRAFVTTFLMMTDWGEEQLATVFRENPLCGGDVARVPAGPDYISFCSQITLSKTNNTLSCN